jgi:hypothetical protein
MTLALGGGEWSAACPSHTLPPGKTQYPLYRRLGGPQSRSGQVRKISHPPGFDPRTVQPIVKDNITIAIKSQQYHDYQYLKSHAMSTTKSREIISMQLTNTDYSWEPSIFFILLKLLQMAYICTWIWATPGACNRTALPFYIWLKPPLFYGHVNPTFLLPVTVPSEYHINKSRADRSISTISNSANFVLN